MTSQWQFQRPEEIAREASAQRQAPRLGYRVLMWASVVLYPALLLWSWWQHRDAERIAQHYGLDGVADRWSSPTVALATALLMPLLILWLPLLSRLATRFPDGINMDVGDKEWWFATGARLARFERLLHEWLLAVVAWVMLTIFVPGEVKMWWGGPDGQSWLRGGWVFGVSLAVFLGGMLWSVLAMNRTFRRRPADLA